MRTQNKKIHKKIAAPFYVQVGDAQIPVFAEQAVALLVTFKRRATQKLLDSAVALARKDLRLQMDGHFSLSLKELTNGS